MILTPTVKRQYKVHHLFWQVLDFLYPPSCGSCGASGSRWCNVCQDSVKKINQSQVCPLCGIPQNVPGLCSECIQFNPVYTALRSWGLYEGPLRSAIHRLKYHSDMGISEELAKPLSLLLTDLGWQVDLITAVPLSTKRRKERGYNQSALLAQWMSQTLGIPIFPKAIRRLRDTTSQVGLHADQRRQNVSGAFSAQPELVAGKSVLIIDDVTTTGATMQACGLALRAAGSYQIFGLTLARAGHIHLS